MISFQSVRLLWYFSQKLFAKFCKFIEILLHHSIRTMWGFFFFFWFDWFVFDLFWKKLIFQTPLSAAVSRNNLSVAKLLIEKGAEPLSRDVRFTFLFFVLDVDNTIFEFFFFFKRSTHFCWPILLCSDRCKIWNFDTIIHPFIFSKMNWNIFLIGQGKYEKRNAL